MNDFSSTEIELNDILSRQNDVLSIILNEQQHIRTAVRQKDWQTLESAIYKVQNVSQDFTALEEERERILKEITQDENPDFYQCAHCFSAKNKERILENFRLLRQKLAVSKIENDSLNEYISVTKNFLQGVFDTLIPHSRGTVYSRLGQIVKTQPESLVLDRLF